MRSILNALQEGRLFELPSTQKDDALEFLARILDANPDIGQGFGFGPRAFFTARL